MGSYWTFLGTYTDQESDGIYCCLMDESTGTLSDPRLAAKTAQPSFLALGPDSDILYAVNECKDGAVTAFRVEDEGGLSELNSQIIGPADPCHCSVDPSSEYLFVAHYTGGAVSILPLADDGTLYEPAVIEHEGSSVHPDRQTSPHPHSVVVGPNGKYLYVPDLGTDEVVVYRINREAGELERRSAVQVHVGAGPRHLQFHDEDAYIINELDSTLSRFAWEPSSGTLKEKATVATLEDRYEEENYTADVHAHPGSDRIYGSNRGHDSIAIIDTSDGDLELLDTESTRGECPRNFAISPEGEYLFAANQHSDTIVPFSINDSGLNATNDIVEVPQPVCIVTVDDSN